MSRKVIAELDGVKYTSYTGIAAALGVSKTTLQKYIQGEGSIEKACDKIRNQEKVIYIWKGQEYTSINSLAHVVGVDRGVINRLLEEHDIKVTNGIVVMDEILDEYFKQREQVYAYHGKEYKTMREAAKALGLNIATISKYLSMADGNLERAMELYEDSMVIAELDGVKYKNQDEIAAALGVSRSTFAKFVKSEGSIEAAYDKIKQEVVTYTWNGQVYKSFASLAKAMGIERVTLKRIMDKETDGDPERAYELYMERSSGKYHGYTYKGVEYSSLKVMLKNLGLSYKTYMRLLPDHGNDYVETIDAMIEMVEQKKSREEEKTRKAEEKQKAKITYLYGGVKYDSIAALSKAIDIPETTLSKILADAEKKNLIVTDRYIEQYLESKITYTYLGQTFLSIKALAEFTGINELRLGRFIRKYDRDAEKAIMIIRERDKQQKKVKIGDAEFDLADLSTILGIKQSALRGFISRGMTVEEIKQHISKENATQIVGGHRGATIMYDNTTSLIQYCVQHKLNYNCIYYAITEYGKSIEEAIEHYRTNGQRIPNTWIYERYNVLLKHLMLSESIDYEHVIAVMRNRQMSLREALEYYVVSQDSREFDLDNVWQHEIYSLLTEEGLSDEERQEIVEAFHVTPKEIHVVEKSRKKARELDRKLLIYELAECIRDEIFQDEEMAELLNLYEITDDELKIIFYDFYVNFREGVLQTDTQQQRKIENDTRLRQVAREKIEHYKKIMNGRNKTYTNPESSVPASTDPDTDDVEI